jgi:hypothetical protein
MSWWACMGVLLMCVTGTTLAQETNVIKLLPPEAAAPINGIFHGDAQSDLQTEVHIDVDE